MNVTRNSFIQEVEDLSGDHGTMVRNLPEAIHSALRYRPAESGKERRLAAAMQSYQQGRVSQELVANIAALGRADFC